VYEECLGRPDPGSGLHADPVLQPRPGATHDTGWLAGVGSVAGLAGGLLQWWRRRAPIAVIGGTTACYVLQASIVGPVVPAAVFLASYSVARYATPVQRAVGGLMAVVVVTDRRRPGTRADLCGATDAGSGLGMLIRNSTVALVTVLLWKFVIEGVLPSLTRSGEVSRWLPSGAADAVLYGRPDLL
jgi:hypothetical protein